MAVNYIIYSEAGERFYEAVLYENHRLQLREDVLLWIKENLSMTPWFLFHREHGDILRFANSDDAAAFKLKWL